MSGEFLTENTVGEFLSGEFFGEFLAENPVGEFLTERGEFLSGEFLSGEFLSGEFLVGRVFVRTPLNLELKNVSLSLKRLPCIEGYYTS